MNDLKKYVAERRKRDKEFASGYDTGYKTFKLGKTLKVHENLLCLGKRFIDHA